MYHFAIVALMALAVVKSIDFLADQWAGLDRLRGIATFVAAIGGVWLLDYSLFEQWGVDVRDTTLGVWMTGFIVAGMTVPWRAVFGFLTHDRASLDETLGEHHPMFEKAA